MLLKQLCPTEAQTQTPGVFCPVLVVDYGWCGAPWIRLVLLHPTVWMPDKSIFVMLTIQQLPQGAFIL